MLVGYDKSEYSEQCYYLIFIRVIIVECNFFLNYILRELFWIWISPCGQLSFKELPFELLKIFVRDICLLLRLRIIVCGRIFFFFFFSVICMHYIFLFVPLFGQFVKELWYKVFNYLRDTMCFVNDRILVFFFFF